MRRRRPTAYLSGAMEYARNEGADWRRELEEWLKRELRHSSFNPAVESAKFRARHVKGRNFRALKTKDPLRFTRLVRMLIDRDVNAIEKRSDYLICYWDQRARRGAGTIGELTVARRRRIPVYLVTRSTAEHIPGWILGCTTRRFASFHQLKEFLASTYSTHSTSTDRRIKR